MKPVSGLAFIPVTHANPMILFHEWKQEALKYIQISTLINTMCLSTVSAERRVSSRNVHNVDIDNEIIFLTDGRSRKATDINCNPNVAATFLWAYMKDDSKIMKQIRIEGLIKQLDRAQCVNISKDMPLFHKIRDQICRQGEEVEWNDLKKQHDKVLEDITQNKMVYTLPDYKIGYKLEPHTMEFYYAYDNYIGDRVKFSKVNDEWNHVHLAA